MDLRYTKADAVQICGKFWNTQYVNLYSLSNPLGIFSGLSEPISRGLERQSVGYKSIFGGHLDF